MYRRTISVTLIRFHLCWKTRQKQSQFSEINISQNLTSHITCRNQNVRGNKSLRWFFNYFLMHNMLQEVSHRNIIQLLYRSRKLKWKILESEGAMHHRVITKETPSLLMATIFHRKVRMKQFLINPPVRLLKRTF